ncbi:RbsD/FucU family protein [Prosthecodimorpha staleyi]|uniref:Transporter n=1 Tax=Prosthecodimorpha staleyi TaxID=2840188 RepID=A0A947GDW2_9HYPH|nr:RbsD/FucU domain-containing protein [Prosthecodimorpha staleyi]MBT9288695.1 transporter [Prosthecodimorpha staleyi]
MLKGIDPVLGPDLIMTLRAMGHGDEIAVVDGNYPAVAHARRLVRMDGHDATRVVDAILSVMPLDDDQAAAFRPGIRGDEAAVEPIMADFAAIVRRHEPAKSVTPLMGQAFYDRVRAAYAVVATGERRLYGNLVLRKGVVRPA